MPRVPGRVLPLDVASEGDAFRALTRRKLERGDNEIGKQSASGLRLIASATPRRKLKYRVVDANGNAVTTESVRVVQTPPDSGGGVAASETTCWECGVDSAGNRHCWKIPCPDIVGPWVPGKLIAVKPTT